MRSISQRELRNDNAAVVREVEAGESFEVTRRGVPVAHLVPVATATDLRLDRAAVPGPPLASLPRVRSAATTAEVLDDLRGDR